MRLPTGELTDHVAITEGQEVTVPIGCMNTAVAFWGADAREFRPERWLDEDGLPKKAQEIQGHRHLLTFVDGHRMCLGRGFALAEFKVRCVVVLSDLSHRAFARLRLLTIFIFVFSSTSFLGAVRLSPPVAHLSAPYHLQAVLGVLIKHYRFELPEGPETKIEFCRGVLPRPRIVGEKGANLPMRVRRVD